VERGVEVHGLGLLREKILGGKRIDIMEILVN
jgi:hypothetical protein